MSEWVALVGAIVLVTLAFAFWRILDDLRSEARYIRTELVSLRNLTRVLIEQRDDAIRSKEKGDRA